MTDEQLKRATEVAARRDYYKNLADKINYEQFRKSKEDDKAREYINAGNINPHKEKWTLESWFRVRLHKKDSKALVGVMPHYELAHEIEIDAEPELIEIIKSWLEKKAAELDEQLRGI